MTAFKKHREFNIWTITAGLMFVFFVISLQGCKQDVQPNYTAKTQQSKLALDTLQPLPGKALLASKCLSCHSATASHDDRLAPPMVAVKMHYKDQETSKEDFVNSIWQFVKDPSQEKVKMHGAIKRFGLMPKQEFKQEDVLLIAEYIYSDQLEGPEWFEDHKKQMGKGKGKGNKNKG